MANQRPDVRIPNLTHASQHILCSCVSVEVCIHCQIFSSNSHQNLPVHMIQLQILPSKHGSSNIGDGCLKYWTGVLIGSNLII